MISKVLMSQHVLCVQVQLHDRVVDTATELENEKAQPSLLGELR